MRLSEQILSALWQIWKLLPVDRGPMGMYFQWVRRFGTQNGAQNRVQNRTQNRVQNGKFDIQSWVLIRPFSASFGFRNGREMAIRPTKKADF